MRKKIAVIGSGYTGATAALFAAQKELGDIVLVDIPEAENPAKGKALDMLEASPILGFDVNITGTSNYEDITDADLVIVTAGIARKPGMTRDDLVKTNQGVMQSVGAEIKKHAPRSIVLVLTNPVDAMTYSMYQATGFEKERVIGQSGVLDTARYRTFIAQALGVSVKDITGFVLGGHGDTMVPLTRLSTVGGVPLSDLMSQEEIDDIVDRTRKGGAEIVNLLGNGSAYYAPAAALVEMAESILKDQKRVLPSIAYLEGEYGIDGIYLGVPAVLGSNGIERVLQFYLTDEEQAELMKSKEAVEAVKNILE